MMKLIDYIIQIGDNGLILGQRLAEWCGHAPALETDIALSNIALDLLGQTRSYFQYAVEVDNSKYKSEDDLAFLRVDREYKNSLLVEYPNEDFAYTIVRQFFFDAFHYLFLDSLKDSKDAQLSAIAIKSLKEVKYHLRFSSQWMLRLGDGTAESQSKMQAAVNDLWYYTGELVTPNELDKAMAAEGIGVDLDRIKAAYFRKIETVVQEATLTVPEISGFQKGGKEGMHSEALGPLLAELQWMQKTYPNMEW